MARYSDSGLDYCKYFGPGQTIVEGVMVPVTTFGVAVIRPVDFGGLVAGRWRNPNFANLSADGALFRIGFGPGNTPTRIRFGNPNDDYPNLEGGQWREFNVPVPFGTIVTPLTAEIVPATWYLPR